MANLLDLFAIGFSSKSLEEFKKRLKDLNKELNITDEKIKQLEKVQDNLNETAEAGAEAQEKNAEAAEETAHELENAKDKAENLKQEINHLNNTPIGKFSQLKNNIAQLGKSFAQLAALGIAIRQSVKFYEQAEQLDFLAQKTNIAVESLQRLGNAAQRYGGTTEGTASTVEQFTSREYKEKALNFGVRVSSDAEQTFENIARRMERLKTDAQRLELAKNLGLDEGTARMLMQGVNKYREELKRADKYKLYTKEDIARMKDYRQIQQDIRANVQNIQAVIYKMLLPAITEVSKKIRLFTNWFSTHTAETKMIAVILGIGTALLAVKGAADLLIGAFKLLNIQILGTPFGWAIALISLLTFAIQDLFVFLQGGESLIGDLWEAWGYDLEEIRAGFEIWGENIKRWWNNFLSIFDKNIEWKNALKDIDVLKPLTEEEQAKLKEFKNRNGSFTQFSDAMMKARQTLIAYNNNPLNAVSAGAISTTFQTLSRNENTNSNIRKLNSYKNSKTENINTFNFEKLELPNVTNGYDFTKDLFSAVQELDNGILT